MFVFQIIDEIIRKFRQTPDERHMHQQRKDYGPDQQRGDVPCMHQQLHVDHEHHEKLNGGTKKDCQKKIQQTT